MGRLIQRLKLLFMVVGVALSCLQLEAACYGAGAKASKAKSSEISTANFSKADSVSEKHASCAYKSHGGVNEISIFQEKPDGTNKILGIDQVATFVCPQFGTGRGSEPDQGSSSVEKGVSIREIVACRGDKKLTAKVSKSSAFLTSENSADSFEFSWETGKAFYRIHCILSKD